MKDRISVVSALLSVLVLSTDPLRPEETAPSTRGNARTIPAAVEEPKAEADSATAGLDPETNTGGDTDQIPGTRKNSAAQESESEWTFRVVPYLWALSLDGSVTVEGLKADVDAPFGDILKDLRGALMLDLGVRRGRIGLFGDVLYSRLKADGSAGTINLDVTMDMVIGKFGLDYCLGPFALTDDEDGPSVTLLPYVGGRVTYLDTEIDPSQLPSIKDAVTWIDPLVGLLTNWNLTHHWNVVLGANVGGFGVGTRLAWEALGTIGYRFHFSESVTGNVQIGYRALYQDYRDGDFEFDVTMHGPIIGFAIDF